MKVVINGMAALERKTGVGHYIDRLHRELPSTVTARLFPGDLMRPVAKRLAPKARTIGGPTTGPATWRSTMGRLAKEGGRAAAQAYFATYSRAQRYDLYHEPNYIPFRSHLPTVLTVHDLSVLLHPEWHPSERVKLHEQKFMTAVTSARHIITGSRQVRQELLNLIPLSPDRVTAVYYGIGEEFVAPPAEERQRLRERWKLPERFFLYVGAVEPRKNLMVAMRAFVDLPASVRERCPLILAGPWAWKSSEVADYFETHAGPAGARHLGYISDADRIGLYACATALVYPSRYEGFGLPPVEMMACGGAVLAGPSRAVREVLGPHATYLDGDDVAGWREAMRRQANDPESTDRDRETRIAHARQYTWSRCARETLAVYRQALGESSVRQAA